MSKEETSTKTIEIPEQLTVNEFAQALGMGVSEVVAELMKNGVMATINDTIDYETAAIVGTELGVDVKPEAAATEQKPAQSEQQSTDQSDASAGEPRPPIVAVMGHVDHGKTTLLDALRQSDVAGGEAGGITQHLGAYQITHNERAITFIDTPGHEAFSVLRQHGARLTDVAILVVAADDGVKPQTEEAITFAQRAGVRIVVAINKIDKPDADPQRTRQQLSDLELVPEEWGGDTVMVDIAAKEGKNLDALLDMVLLVADIEELTARAEGPAAGTAVESHMAKGKGPVATLLVEQGVLRPGDYLVVGNTYGRVRSMENNSGDDLEAATPAMPAVVSGIKQLPSFGDSFEVVASEKEAKTKSAERARQQPHPVTAGKITKSEDLAAAIAAHKTKQLPLVVKADVRGSLQSLVDSLEGLGNDEVKVKIVGSSVGNVNESDVSLAESSDAVILGFNVILPVRVKQQAARLGVPVRMYKVIYELLDDVKSELSELLEPEVIEKKVGALDIQGIFRTTKKNVIAGGRVTEGKITAGLIARQVQEGDEPPQELGEVQNVQREQTAVKQVKEGDMCGVSINTQEKANLKIGDQLEFISRRSKQRTLQ